VACDRPGTQPAGRPSINNLRVLAVAAASSHERAPGTMGRGHVIRTETSGQASRAAVLGRARLSGWVPEPTR
jgi:hypothetical protein